MANPLSFSDLPSGPGTAGHAASTLPYDTAKRKGEALEPHFADFTQESEYGKALELGAGERYTTGVTDPMAEKYAAGELGLTEEEVAQQVGSAQTATAQQAAAGARELLRGIMGGQTGVGGAVSDQIQDLYQGALKQQAQTFFEAMAAEREAERARVSEVEQALERSAARGQQNLFQSSDMVKGAAGNILGAVLGLG